jgi:hypothetical protein
MQKPQYRAQTGNVQAAEKQEFCERYAFADYVVTQKGQTLHRRSKHQHKEKAKEK